MLQNLIVDQTMIDPHRRLSTSRSTAAITLTPILSPVLQIPTGAYVGIVRSVFYAKRVEKVVTRNTPSHHRVELCILHAMMGGGISGDDVEPQTLHSPDAFMHAFF